MSKKCQRESAKLVNGAVKNSGPEKAEKNHTYDAALDAVIGTANVNQWNELKEAFYCKTNVEFATVLLNLAEEQLNRLELFNKWLCCFKTVSCTDIRHV